MAFSLGENEKEINYVVIREVHQWFFLNVRSIFDEF